MSYDEQTGNFDEEEERIIDVYRKDLIVSFQGTIEEFAAGKKNVFEPSSSQLMKLMYAHGASAKAPLSLENSIVLDAQWTPIVDDLPVATGITLGADLPNPSESPSGASFAFQNCGAKGFTFTNKPQVLKCCDEDTVQFEQLAFANENLEEHLRNHEVSGKAVPHHVHTDLMVQNVLTNGLIHATIAGNPTQFYSENGFQPEIGTMFSTHSQEAVDYAIEELKSVAEQLQPSRTHNLNSFTQTLMPLTEESWDDVLSSPELEHAIPQIEESLRSKTYTLKGKLTISYVASPAEDEVYN